MSSNLLPPSPNPEGP
uniref:Coiled-coil domain containing 38 n=1 Tax=Propithecus coquereli TaxID=379532 RepID=A0A2K6GX60_PROCO